MGALEGRLPYPYRGDAAREKEKSGMSRHARREELYTTRRQVFTCPHCGERISMILDLSSTSATSSEVCCNPRDKLSGGRRSDRLVPGRARLSGQKASNEIQKKVPDSCRKPLFFVVPGTRLELAHPCEHKNLNLACLPIPPPGQVSCFLIISIFLLQAQKSKFPQESPKNLTNSHP